ncbi:MAG TPA: MFS transporter [Candidatus Angelobacter sp.]|nr:MFS transporter [Candidatus Angelobacter sp.]
MSVAEKPGLAARAALTHPNFTRYLTARLFIVLSLEMQSVAVGWQVYEITKRPLDLGLVGLAQFLPGLLLFLIAGHTVDRVNRRSLLALCQGGFSVCSALLLTLALRGIHSVSFIYAVTILLGIVRSFNGPAGQALVPQLVPKEHFPNAVAWGATVFHGATILGPTIGGLTYGFFGGPAPVYATAMVSALFAMVSTLRIKSLVAPRSKEPATLNTLLAGLRFIWRQKLILGSISLDLFAMLLGGAVALMPVIAREILHTGPWGLGVLRSSPGVGAAAMAVVLAYRPLRRRSGTAMLWCVAAFGVFTILFGISHSLPLSCIMLFLVGASDMVSVMVRSTLIQLGTPDEMRGRVSSVNMLFIGASNELGQFESGITAHWFGTVPAVILGGIGTLIVIVVWTLGFPELRKAESPA